MGTPFVSLFIFSSNFYLERKFLILYILGGVGGFFIPSFVINGILPIFHGVSTLKSLRL